MRSIKNFITKSFITILMMVGMFAVVATTTAVTAAGAYYEKVTEAPDDWSGDYLIVYEEDGVAFNGALTTLDAASNNVAVTITEDGKITADDDANAAKFTIAKSDTSYTIKSSSGYYIGNTADSNKLNSSTSTQYTNTISLNSDGSVHIVGSGKSVLRYNANSDNCRFRYFKSNTYTGQKAIHLYKYVEEVEKQEYTISYYDNTNKLDDLTPSTYISSQGATLPIPTKENYTFDGWYENSSFTGSAVTAISEGSTGNKIFYAKWIDNSVVYCDVTFDSDGGSEVPSQSVQKGQVATKPANPTKTGHTFIGWQLNGVDYNFTEPVTQDIELVAVWEAKTQYTITLDVNGGTLPNGASSSISYYEDEYTSVVLPTPTHEKHRFEGWYDGETLVESITTNGNFELKAKWAEVSVGTETYVAKEQGIGNGSAAEDYKGNSFNLTFDKGTNNNATKYYDGGEALRAYGGNKLTFTAKSGYTITKIVFTFASGEGTNAITSNVETFNTDTWTGSADSVTFTIGGNSGHRRISKIEVTYEGTVDTTLYNVVFMADGVQVGEALTYTVSNNTIDEPAVPEKAHYTGVWETYELNGGNKTVNAVYTPIEYTVTFVADGNTVATKKYNIETESITNPSIPSKEGYSKSWEPYTLDGGNKTVNAVYEIINYTVSFDAGEGSENPENLTINIENYKNVELPEPTKEGYTFLGWYEGESKVDELENRNYELVAQWGKNEATYTVSFDAAGVVENPDSLNFTDYTTVELPEITKEGYIFLGWYEGESKVQALSENRDYNLEAKWEAKLIWTIQLNANGGTVEDDEITFYDGEHEDVVLPEPTYEGYEFLGWYDGEIKVTSVLSQSYNLVAKWEKITTETEIFVAKDNGYENAKAVSEYAGTSFNIVFNKGTGQNAPAYYDTGKAVRVYYGGYFTISSEYSIVAIKITFSSDDNGNEITADNGQYDNGNWVGSSTSVKFSVGNNSAGETKGHRRIAEIEVTYSMIENYKVSFMDGQSVISSTIVLSGEKVSMPETPVKEGHTFLGWYKEITLESEFDFDSEISADTNVYAKWEEKIVYTIHYDAKGGMVENEQVPFYDGEHEKVSLQEVSYSGFIFIGWYEIQDEIEVLVESIDSSRDYYLYAKWERKILTGYQVEVVGGSYYELVTDVSELNDGDKVIIVGAHLNSSTSEISYYALSSNIRSSNIAGTEVAVSENRINAVNSNVQLLTVGAGTIENTYTFYVDTENENNKGYLYASSSSSNQLKIQKTLNGNGCWSINIADGIASILASGSNSNNVMQMNYNNNNPVIFSCYATDSQEDVCIYKYVDAASNYESVNVRLVGAFGGDYPEAKVDDLDAVGFEITATNANGYSATVSVTCNTVYTGLNASVYGERVEITAKSLGCAYMYGYVLSNIPVGTTITIKSVLTIDEVNEIYLFGNEISFKVTASGVEPVESI